MGSDQGDLPGREGHVGGTAADNRLFVEAVLFRFRAGVPWRDLPARFGDWKIVYQRFNRWAKSGVFERVFRLLASDHDNETESEGQRKGRTAGLGGADGIGDPFAGNGVGCCSLGAERGSIVTGRGAGFLGIDGASG